MKRLFSMLAVVAIVVCSAFSLKAENDDVTLLTVNLANGKIEQFNLHDLPEVTFADGKLSVNAQDMSGEYNLDEVSHFSFDKGKAVAAIEDIAAENADFFFSYTDNATLYLQAANLKSADVFSIAGVKVASAVANAEGALTIDLSRLPAGVYVVAPDCHSAMKIVRR